MLAVLYIWQFFTLISFLLLSGGYERRFISQLKIYHFVRQYCIVKNRLFLQADLYSILCNMTYKVDKEYIVTVVDHNSLPILCYQRPSYLPRTSFARGKKPGISSPTPVFESARPLWLDMMYLAYSSMPRIHTAYMYAYCTHPSDSACYHVRQFIHSHPYHCMGYVCYACLLFAFAHNII